MSQQGESKLITRAQFSEVIERAYKAGVLAERKGKHEIADVIDSESLKEAFEGFDPLAELIKQTNLT